MIPYLFAAQGVDSSYHLRINMSVKTCINWGISVHSVHKGEVLISTSVYI